MTFGAWFWPRFAGAAMSYLCAGLIGGTVDAGAPPERAIAVCVLAGLLGAALGALVGLGLGDRR